MLNTFTLKNGVKVIGYRSPHLKSLRIVITAKAGSSCDPAGKSGLGHFMEHMLLEGTPSWPTGDKLRNYIQSLAGKYSAQTGQIATDFALTLPFHYLDEALKIGSEVFFQSLFPVQAFERERQAIIQEINQRINSSWYPKVEFFKKIRYVPGHPLIPDGGGDTGAIQSLTREEVVNYYQKYFVPGNTYLGVFGDFSEKQLRDLVEKYFGRFPATEIPSLPEMTPSGLSQRTVAIRQDQKLQSNGFDFSFPTTSLSDPLPIRTAQYLATQVLGSLGTSRLMTKLRYQKGYVYSVSSGNSRFPHFGYGYVSTETITSHLDETIKIVVDEILETKKNGLTGDELSRVKKYMEDIRSMLFDTPWEISDWFMDELLWQDKIRLLEEYDKISNAVSSKDVVDSLQKYWDFSKLNLTIQGPIENSKANIEKFEEIVDPLK